MNGVQMSTATKKDAKTTTGAKSTKTAASAAKAAAAPRRLAGEAPLSALDGSLPAPSPASAKTPQVTKSPNAVIVGPMMRKKELIDTVVTRSGRKKKDVKPVVEAMLEVLGEALEDNRELNLQPMGKLKVRREKMMPNGRILIAKIRQPVRNSDAE